MRHPFACKARCSAFCSLVIVLAMIGCKATDRNQNASSVEGFSANSTILTKNAAVLMTSYGSTPQNAQMFEQDLNNLHAVVTDPKANYRFDTTIYHQVGHNAMGLHIQEAARKVSGDGTLLIFITAHGHWSGVIQPADQQYATFGYENILANIRAARKDRGPFQRLVIVVSACYSGSWLNTLSSSSDIARQRLVMTSVSAGSQSIIGSATNAMHQAFAAMKQNPNQTMGQFITAAQSYSGGVLQYSVSDNAILAESFLNKTIDLSRLAENDTGIEVHALTKRVADKDSLFLYASKKLPALYLLDGSKKPYACSVKMQPQEAWPHICQIVLNAGSPYMTYADPIQLIFEYQDKIYSDDVMIEHQ